MDSRWQVPDLQSRADWRPRPVGPAARRRAQALSAGEARLRGTGFARRALAGLCVERIRRQRSVCLGVPRPGKMAGLLPWRRVDYVEQRRQAALLYGAEAESLHRAGDGIRRGAAVRLVATA